MKTNIAVSIRPLKSKKNYNSKPEHSLTFEGQPGWM
jgi:hypothetical protein